MKTHRLRRVSDGDYMDEKGRLVICDQGVKALGWPKEVELEVTVRRDKAPGFTEVAFEYIYGSGAIGYEVTTDGKFFSTAYCAVLDALDENDHVLYYKVEAAA